MARPPIGSRLVLFTGLAMLAFAGNSLLCRMALQTQAMDAASFTVIRMLSGALVLVLLVGGRRALSAGSWPSAAALFAYAAAFSVAYVALPAGTGALLLFASVQITMIGSGLWRGERLGPWQWAGFLLAVSGLFMLLLPRAAAPLSYGSALAMIAAGVAWGVYSLRGAGPQGPLASTAGNFLRAVPMALVLGLVQWPAQAPSLGGSVLAVASGALTSGVGYALWYAALPGLRASQAAVIQLTVPVIAAIGGVILLGEVLSLTQLLASGAVLGGVSLVLMSGPRLRSV